MTRDAGTDVPSVAAVAAEPRFLPARRRRRFPWAPWLLLLPVALALVAVLGYPSYKLVTLSFQRYGLFELIQKQGHWIGLDNFDSVLHDRVFWDTVVRTVIFTIVNVGLTIVLGTLIALLLTKLSRWVRILLLTASRARLVDAGRRRRPGLLLDDELPERRHHLHPRAAPPDRTRITTGTGRRRRAWGW